MEDANTRIVRDLIFDGAARKPSSKALDCARWKLLGKGGAFPVNPDRCDIWVGNTRDVESLGSASFLDLLESIDSVGQKVPAIARISPLDSERLEIIAGACRITAIRRINALRPADNQLRIVVDLRELDNEAALKIVDAENRGRSDMSMLEKARFYERAINSLYHTEKALAEALGLDKSTVNRTLAITRLPPEVLALVKNPHSISAAQASDFMVDWNKPELRDTLTDCIDELTTKGRATAAAVFGSLKKAVAPFSSSGSVAMVADGVEIGALRYQKDGGLIIQLNSDARALGWKRVTAAVDAALKHLAIASDG